MSASRALLCACLFALSIAVGACAGGDDDGGGALVRAEWPMLSGSLDRTGYNQNETAINRDNVSRLAVKWTFDTGGPIPASPVVATIDLPDEGPVQLVFVGSYDGNVYAIRAATGGELWRYAVKPHPGASYGAVVSSASIAEIDGRARVFVGGGMTMYALDAATGAEVWQFDAGTGCTTCDDRTERNEILSSPAVLPDADLVAFGMDLDDRGPGKGGFYRLSARDGRLRWYFDLETGATCRPNEDDDIRRFDGYHSAEELGLPDDFFATRDGCDFDRAQTACGSVWSPVSADVERELLFFSSSNCDTDDDPDTIEPPPPMPLYDEAIVALRFDGTPAWTWRPREVDNDDLAFGAAPNLFSAEIEGEQRDVVGIGGKDGSYYVLDRDGVNEITGEVEPYWSRNLVPGNDIGGTTGTAAVADGRIFLTTAINPGARAWSLETADGAVVWANEEAPPYYSASTAIPGLLFTGGIDAMLHAIDRDTGQILVALPLGQIGFSAPAVVDGAVYVGSGFGTQGGAAGAIADDPAVLWAFCIAGEEGCTNATPPASP